MQVAVPHKNSDFYREAGEYILAPWRPWASPEEILNALWLTRQRSIVVTSLLLLNRYPTIADETGFAYALERFTSLPPRTRRALVESPPLRTWLWLMGEQKHDMYQIRKYLTEFVRLIQCSTVASQDNFTTHSYDIQRYDVHPLIQEVAPPSFAFDNLEERRASAVNKAYSLPFFATAVETALYEISCVWPEMARAFPLFVKTIIHIPELEYRSCSAQRYAGAIILSAADDSLLSLEESLVHECGHQILYCFMELNPLIHNDAKRMFKLPWSGSERDVYGYFHATYIYTLLALYMKRARTRALTNHDLADKRFREILDGLERALPDFQEPGLLTPAGHELMNAISAAATSLLEVRRMS